VIKAFIFLISDDESSSSSLDDGVYSPADLSFDFSASSLLSSETGVSALSFSLVSASDFSSEAVSSLPSTSSLTFSS
jgi:hypothetical protein